jgi:hypothetical protein
MCKIEGHHLHLGASACRVKAGSLDGFSCEKSVRLAMTFEGFQTMMGHLYQKCLITYVLQ